MFCCNGSEHGAFGFGVGMTRPESIQNGNTTKQHG
ncbi:MAG: hypothetical protein JWP78_415 [Mucilaginibacter sp.]|nr:hypothetical protein [Mucilaginibacter sp.]